MTELQTDRAAAIDPVHRREQMYPTLTPDQVDEARPFGQPQRFAAGDVLWEIGQRALAFYIVQEGVLEVVRRDAFGAEAVLVRLEPGNFSGETATLAGRAAMVSGRAATDLEVLAVPADRLRELVVTRARIGELIMRAFILRRMRLISERASDLLLVGSRFCPGTLQLQDFLTRNGHPYTFLDLDAAAGMCTALDRLNIQPRDIPLVITSSGEPLRNPSLRAVSDRLGLSPAVDEQRVYDVAVVGAGPAGPGGRHDTCSSSSAPAPTRTSCHPACSPTSAASSAPVRRSWKVKVPRSGRSAGHPIPWNRAARACSPPATCAPPRPNGWRPPWAKARWRCSTSTGSSPSAGVAPRSRHGSGVESAALDGRAAPLLTPDWCARPAFGHSGEGSRVPGRRGRVECPSIRWSAAGTAVARPRRSRAAARTGGTHFLHGDDQ